MRLAEQTKCKHPFEFLAWGGNKHCKYATCKKCNLGSVILFNKKKRGEEEFDFSQTSGYTAGDNPNGPSFRGATPQPSQGAYVDSAFNQPHGGVTHELYVVEDIPSLHISFVNETYMVKLRPGLIMADTGCKKAVAGSEWHQEIQGKMDKEGKGYCSYPIHEYFKFGPG